MVGKYKRKTTRQEWSEELMNRALQAVENNEMGWLKAAEQFGVSQATLRRRSRNGKNKKFRGSTKGLGRFQTIFNEDTERN